MLWTLGREFRHSPGTLLNVGLEPGERAQDTGSYKGSRQGLHPLQLPVQGPRGTHRKEGSGQEFSYRAGGWQQGLT